MTINYGVCKAKKETGVLHITGNVLVLCRKCVRTANKRATERGITNACRMPAKCWYTAVQCCCALFVLVEVLCEITVPAFFVFGRYLIDLPLKRLHTSDR